jgi:hypothetical protein
MAFSRGGLLVTSKRGSNAVSEVLSGAFWVIGRSFLAISFHIFNPHWTARAIFAAPTHVSRAAQRVMPF